MKTVVMTGSGRGLGFEMAKVFRKNHFNVVLSDLSEENLLKARDLLLEINSDAQVSYHICNVTKEEDIKQLVQFAINEFNAIDIWINNAGVNQPDLPIWELEDNDIKLILDIDLKGAILGSKYAMKEMIKHKKGAIYNIEGYGSNDAKMLGLSLYGTAKRGVTYFTEALAKECSTTNNNIIIGKLSPGIMITDFITNALANKEKIELSEKTKKVYNILGDYPDVVANYLVEKMIQNQKNNVKINWLPNWKAAWRFMTACFNKRDFFKEKK